MQLLHVLRWVYFKLKRTRYEIQAFMLEGEAQHAPG